MTKLGSIYKFEVRFSQSDRIVFTTADCLFIQLWHRFSYSKKNTNVKHVSSSVSHYWFVPHLTTTQIQKLTHENLLSGKLPRKQSTERLLEVSAAPKPLKGKSGRSEGSRLTCVQPAVVQNKLVMHVFITLIFSVPTGMETAAGHRLRQQILTVSKHNESLKIEKMTPGRKFVLSRLRCSLMEPC